MSGPGRSRLGSWSIALLGIHAVIGSGIFLLPGKAMALVGPGSVLVYLFITLVVLAVALCFAESAGRFSRNGAALAEDGLMPRRLAALNRFGAPHYSILVTVLLTIPLALSGSFTQLAAISMVSRFAQYLPTRAALLVLRLGPGLPASLRIPLGHSVPIATMGVCLWLLGKAMQPQLLWGLGALALGIPLSLLFRAFSPKPAASAGAPAPTTLPEVQP